MLIYNIITKNTKTPRHSPNELENFKPVFWHNTVCHKILCNCILSFPKDLVDMALHPSWYVKMTHYYIPSTSSWGHNRYSLGATILWLDDKPWARAKLQLCVMMVVPTDRCLINSPSSNRRISFYESQEVSNLTILKLKKN